MFILISWVCVVLLIIAIVVTLFLFFGMERKIIEPAAIELPQVETVPIPKDEGLQLRFKVGQQLPWAGIWFGVSKVEKEMIELKPIRLTWQKSKQLNRGG